MSQKPQTITKTQRLSFQIQKTKTATRAQGTRLKSQKNANQKAGVKKQRPKAATSTTVQGSRTNDETIGNNNVIARLKRQRVNVKK